MSLCVLKRGSCTRVPAARQALSAAGRASSQRLRLGTARAPRTRRPAAASAQARSRHPAAECALSTSKGSTQRLNARTSTARTAFSDASASRPCMSSLACAVLIVMACMTPASFGLARSASASPQQKTTRQRSSAACASGPSASTLASAPTPLPAPGCSCSAPPLGSSAPLGAESSWSGKPSRSGGGSSRSGGGSYSSGTEKRSPVRSSCSSACTRIQGINAPLASNQATSAYRDVVLGHLRRGEDVLFVARAQQARRIRRLHPGAERVVRTVDHVGPEPAAQHLPSHRRVTQSSVVNKHGAWTGIIAQPRACRPSSLPLRSRAATTCPVTSLARLRLGAGYDASRNRYARPVSRQSRKCAAWISEGAAPASDSRMW